MWHKVRGLIVPGRYADGNGLYLFVDRSGAKRWILRIVIRGKRSYLGLGGAGLVSLAEAWEETLRLRKIARKGGDPLAERRKQRIVIPTFEQAAREVHKSCVPTFRNAKHAAQWISTLQTYAFTVFGSRPVNTIETPDVLSVLSPIWSEKAETAKRVRQRMRTVFDWAKAKGDRPDLDNPVEGVSMALPKTNGKKEHHPALPYAQVPEFVVTLRNCDAGVSAQVAFEPLILTAARTSEVLPAKWDETDLKVKTLTVPATA